MRRRRTPRTASPARIDDAAVATTAPARARISSFLALPIALASTPALADTQAAPEAAKPEVRVGATAGFQQTDRSAWVVAPTLEVRVYRDIWIRGEAQTEFGDIDDPFGPSNVRGGDGPHVNHAMFGPTWRPARYDAYQLAVGAQVGMLTMHSTFGEEHFHRGPAVGLLVQAGRMLGPVSLALQLRFDASATIEMSAPDGGDVTTTSGRINLAFEVPIDLIR